MTWVAVIGLCAFVVIVFLLVEASRRLLEIHADHGRVVKIEGRAPAELVGDFKDVLARSRASGTIIVRLEAGRAVVQVRGAIDENTAQQLRNVVGRFPTARLKAGRRVGR